MPVDLAELSDRLAIEDLLYEYAELVDEARVDDLLELFTTDVVFDYGFDRIFRGREELRPLYEQRLVRDYRSTSHHVSNVRIGVDGDRAWSRSYFMAWHERASDGAHPRVWGRYLDELVRTVDGWRIASRAVRAAGLRDNPAPEGFPAMLEAPPRRTPSR